MSPVTETQRQMWRDAVAAQLKAERALRGLDQDAVCERANISRSTYSRMERGAGATLDQLLAVAEVLGIPLSEFIARAEAEMKRRQADPVEAPKRTAYPQRARTAGNAKSSRKANVSTRQSP